MIVSGASSRIRIDQGAVRMERTRKAPWARGPLNNPVTASMRPTLDART